MVVWLRPEYILAIVTSLYYCSQIVLSKTYDKFYCTTEEGRHQISCPDETALLTDISIRKVYRRTQMCQPDDHSEYLAHCQTYIDGSICEGNKTCSIEISSRDSIQCGDKIYTPTYFFVKYTCIQIYTMCIDTLPIRNTLYGYIVSPAYPHPMADNLKCSINIEADPSMYIELSPIEIHLQEAFKCRSEYIEIFGYDSSSDDKNLNNLWKSYHTWCGADRSSHNPLYNTRHLISSNSLYMSLQTAVSKKPRYFKIRYRVVPSTIVSQSYSNGISHKEGIPAMKMITSTVIISTTIIIPSLNNSDVNYLNGTLTKTTFKKGIIIGIMVGIVMLLMTIIVGIIVFIFTKRCRSSTSSNTGKKTASSPSTTINTTSKSNAKSSDKAPLLEPTNNTSTKPAAAAKQKLVPERTIQISDAGTSKLKSNAAAGQTNPGTTATKPTLSAADSGIYGADTSDDTVVKIVTSPLPAFDSLKIHGIDLPDVSEPVPTVVVNPLTENSTISAIVLSETIETDATTPTNEEKEPILNHFDNTIQSAYSNLIDATISENEGTICGSALQSRRTSSIKSPEPNHLGTIIISEESERSFHHTVPFNPLHVILKKDAQKYYTTEYI